MTSVSFGLLQHAYYSLFPDNIEVDLNLPSSFLVDQKRHYKLASVKGLLRSSSFTLFFPGCGEYGSPDPCTALFWCTSSLRAKSGKKRALGKMHNYSALLAQKMHCGNCSAILVFTLHLVATRVVSICAYLRLAYHVIIGRCQSNLPGHVCSMHLPRQPLQLAEPHPCKKSFCRSSTSPRPCKHCFSFSTFLLLTNKKLSGRLSISGKYRAVPSRKRREAVDLLRMRDWKTRS